MTFLQKLEKAIDGWERWESVLPVVEMESVTIVLPVVEVEGQELFLHAQGDKNNKEWAWSL